MPSSEETPHPLVFTKSKLYKYARGVRTMTEASVTPTDSDAAKSDSKGKKRWFPLGEIGT